MNLIIGTASFGQPYGKIKPTRPIENEKIGQILNLAQINGTNTLDTAINYGDTHAKIGLHINSKWRVITKLPSVESVGAPLAYEKLIRDSLSKLNITKLYGILLHRPEELNSSVGSEIYKVLLSLKYQGLTEKIGLSIYDPCDLASVFPKYQLDIIQAPLNVLDQRIIQTGWLEKIHRNNIEFHARSIFLQGLLLTPFEELPPKFKKYKALKKWNDWIETNRQTRVKMCIHAVKNQLNVNSMVVGVNSTEELTEILCNFNTAPEPQVNIKNFISNDLELIDPRYW